MEKYLAILKKHWGYNSFRLVQEQIITSVAQGKDTLGIMPTGGGKSITFQVPALAMDGVCLVISPLIALMNDQVERLNSMGIKARALHSGLSYHELLTSIDNAVYGAYKFLYLSPERLSTELFKMKLREIPVSLVTIDEAHCISQWGYDFRPSYLQIAELRKQFPDIPFLALTATATPEVIEDIQDKLRFRNKNVIQSGFTRENLVYFVRQSESKITDLIKVVQSIKGSGIIYLRNRKKTREIAEQLMRSNISADYYHAGLSYENRSLKQEKWTRNETRIMVATNAFGMGIDKPDVRFVIHLELPDSPEAYIQEAGRAGRDEKKAWAVLIVNNYDKRIVSQRLQVNFPEIPEIKRIYSALCNFLQVPLGSGKGIAFDFNMYEFASAFKLNVLIAYNALKLIEKQGYIELTDEVNNPTRLMFLLNRDDLYKFQIENQKFDGFIKLVLRSYTGLFSDYVKVDEEVLSKRANINRDLVYQYLTTLSKMKVISYIPPKKTPLVIFTEERLDEKTMYIDFNFYEERKARYKKRMDAMLDYAFSTQTCRNNLMLKYFGQAPTKPCGHCDICRSRMEEGLSEVRILQLKTDILLMLKKNPLYVGELQLALELKEDVINSVVADLLSEEKILYLDDGRLSIDQ
ncbi:MAG: RecQ family ATP-dependent DNA helicase [Bacteroidales bacterium]|nr:RecQ family ATP-dependent DNA helicase [Bacteroidales bacterium]